MVFSTNITRQAANALPQIMLEGELFMTGTSVIQTTVEDAHTLLAEPDTVLVDVRTKEEWQTVGVPSLANYDKPVVFIELMQRPDMALNPDFASQLKAAVPTDKRVLFMCKVGGRSQAAAEIALSLGYGTCYNIDGGFEGHNDARGWKEAELPTTMWEAH